MQLIGVTKWRSVIIAQQYSHAFKLVDKVHSLANEKITNITKGNLQTSLGVHALCTKYYKYSAKSVLLL